MFFAVEHTVYIYKGSHSHTFGKMSSSSNQQEQEQEVDTHCVVLDVSVRGKNVGWESLNLLGVRCCYRPSYNSVELGGCRNVM